MNETLQREAIEENDISSQISLDVTLNQASQLKAENQPAVAIMLPTYREAQNIESLIRDIQKLNLNSSIIVIDDSSPDRTADIVRQLQKEYSN
ncbi:MAG TPA: glycosyltransferase, partial [Candidatus Krumholzibacteriaceae bacterium]|nr:glycosyltransferase [Candidatus Krumholzibacteriaceae bacterium]